MKDALGDRPLSPATTAWLVLAVAAAVGPHAWHLPPAITAFFGLAAAYRLLTVAQPRLLPGRALLGVLLLAGLATVWVAQGAVPNRDSGVALLTVMLGLKLLEVRTRRDVFVTVFLLIIGSGFFHAVAGLATGTIGQYLVERFAPRSSLRSEG